VHSVRTKKTFSEGFGEETLLPGGGKLFDGGCDEQYFVRNDTTYKFALRNQEFFQDLSKVPDFSKRIFSRRLRKLGRVNQMVLPQ